MIDLCVCLWCNEEFEVDSETRLKPSYCTNAHYQKAYRSGVRAGNPFKIPADKTKLAYLAGLIDSDGHISITKSEPTNRSRAKTTMHYVLVGVTNTDETMLEWITENFGGWYGSRMGNKMEQKYIDKNWKSRYAWQMTGEKAEILLQALLPFLVVKKNRAELAIQLGQTRIAKANKYDKLSPETVAIRENIRQQIMVLNKKGRI